MQVQVDNMAAMETSTSSHGLDVDAHPFQEYSIIGGHLGALLLTCSDAATFLQLPEAQSLSHLKQRVDQLLQCRSVEDLLHLSESKFAFTRQELNYLNSRLLDEIVSVAAPPAVLLSSDPSVEIELSFVDTDNMVLPNTASAWSDILIKAASLNSVDTLVFLLNRGVSPNVNAAPAAASESKVALSSNRPSALMYACLNSHVEAAELLLKHGADARAIDQQAFMMACIQANPSLTYLLCRAGADVNVYWKDDGASPLTVAAHHGSAAVVSCLLDFGADCNARSGMALRCAASAGHADTVRILLQRGARADCISASVFYSIAGSGYLDVMKLLEPGLQAIRPVYAVDTSEVFPLHAAATNGHLDVVAHCLKQGSRADAFDSIALVAACGRRHDQSVPIIQLLLDRGATVNANASAPLTAACAADFVEAAELLLERGATLSAPSLQRTCRTGSRALLSLLMSKLADHPARADMLALGLVEAASCGRDKMVQVLLDAGADVNALDCRALQFAIRLKALTTVHLLLKHGADLARFSPILYREAVSIGAAKLLPVLREAGAGAPSGAGLLTAAIAGRHRACLAWLLEEKVDVHEHEDAALIQAVDALDQEMAAALLKHGANVHAQDDEALFIALSKSSSDMARFLLEHGANVHARKGTALNQAGTLFYHFPLTRLLLDHGADVHAQDDLALITAAEGGQYKTVELLLERGANVHARQGLLLVQTPARIAMFRSSARHSPSPVETVWGRIWSAGGVPLPSVRP